MSLRPTRTLAAVALATLAALTLPACSGPQQPAAPAPATTGTGSGPSAGPEPDPATEPATEDDPAPDATTPATAKPKPKPAPKAALADGRWPAFVTGVGDDQVTFDLVEFLTGEDAAAAWKKKNPGSDETGPPNDYYIVNDNTKKRVLPVAGSVVVRVVGGVGPEADTAASLGDLTELIPETLFWLTVTKGSVTRVEQQYLP